MDDPRIGNDIGLLVVDARTGTVLAGHHADRLMQPASNMKIITAVTSLASLGPEHRFPTALLAGQREGHVFLRGGGDPLLTRQDLGRLARRAAKVLDPRRVVVVHVDTSLFTRATPAPGWHPAVIGSAVGEVESLALAGDRGQNPARRAGEVFAAALRSLGLGARLGDNGSPPASASEVARIRGHTVAESVAVMLQRSESAVSEVLFRQVALAAGHRPTWAGGQQSAREVLATLGLDVTGMRLVDGSGLSRRDAVSPRFLVSVLRVARIEQADRFLAMFDPRAMPVAGRTGSLTAAYGRYSTAPSSCASGDVQAKTGTIASTIALSGVARTHGAGRRLFSIIVNHRPVRYPPLATRRAIDGLAATIVGCW